MVYNHRIGGIEEPSIGACALYGRSKVFVPFRGKSKVKTCPLLHLYCSPDRGEELPPEERNPIKAYKAYKETLSKLSKGSNVHVKGKITELAIKAKTRSNEFIWHLKIDPVEFGKSHLRIKSKKRTPERIVGALLKSAKMYIAGMKVIEDADKRNSLAAEGRNKLNEIIEKYPGTPAAEAKKLLGSPDLEIAK